MIENLSSVRESALADIEGAKTLDEMEQQRIALFGKKGAITQLLKGLKDVPPEQKREVGQAVNELKNELQDSLNAKRESLQDTENSIPSFDVTLPGNPTTDGCLHPITQMIDDLNDAFMSLGFEIFEGPEITSELYAFDSLNFPPDHPARESMDTYWLEGADNETGAKRLCLRPHLTGTSIRYMQQHEPPFRFVYPGRVYRNEVTDARHERAFFQYEALIVDKSIPFSSGQLLIKTILDRVFRRSVETRMRAGFFPFVEPGFEIDMKCQVCNGKGCSVCKHVGWIEVMPGGAPHPNVLRAGGIDPNKWTGFYINVGLDRLVMMRTGIDDVRHFHSGDLRFLSQFK
ncbi:MAG: phenylalanyl-tRNA synthetase alpha chain [Pirellulaceae bacterium]|jgi:phenylalanyl-tRNA synthetase alpha chain